MKALNIDAIKFFKDNGLVQCKAVIAMSDHALVDVGDGSYFHINQLKRIVESHELVDSYGGLQGVLIELSKIGVFEDGNRVLLARIKNDIELCKSLKSTLE